MGRCEGNAHSNHNTRLGKRFSDGKSKTVEIHLALFKMSYDITSVREFREIICRRPHIHAGCPLCRSLAPIRRASLQGYP